MTCYCIILLSLSRHTYRKKKTLNFLFMKFYTNILFRRHIVFYLEESFTVHRNFHLEFCPPYIQFHPLNVIFRHVFLYYYMDIQTHTIYTSIEVNFFIKKNFHFCGKHTQRERQGIHIYTVRESGIFYYIFFP